MNSKPTSIGHGIKDLTHTEYLSVEYSLDGSLYLYVLYFWGYVNMIYFELRQICG